MAGDAADMGDATVTSCVHAGIAAADAITASRREVHPDGAELAGHLAALVGLKTKAGYTHRPVSAQERTQAGRALARSSTPPGAYAYP